MTQVNWEFTDNARVGGYIVTATNWNDLAGSLRSLIDQTTSAATDATPLPIGIDLLNDRVYISDPDTTTPEAANHAATVLSVVGATTLAGDLTWDSTTLSNLITSAEGFAKDDVSLATGLAISNYIATVASPAGSDGYIQYKNGSVFGGEAELFWDDTNNRLGVGTASPATTLHTFGATTLSSTTGVGNTHLPFTDGRFYYTADPQTGGTGDHVFRHYSGGAYVEQMRILENGNVGVGTTAPAFPLDVTGDARVTGAMRPGTLVGDTTTLHMARSGKWLMTLASSEVSPYDTSVSLGSGSRYWNGVYSSNYFRSSGNTGWYSQDYNGGWFMQDTTWVRSYANKGIYTAGVIRGDDEIQTGYGSAADPSFTFWQDTNTGMFHLATDQWGLCGAGVQNAFGTNTSTIGTAGTATATGAGYQYVFRNNTYGTLYRYTSRRDMKEQITPLADAGSIVDALSPVTFIPAFNPMVEGETETDNQKQLREVDLNYGFIADEVAEVADGKLAQWEWQDDGTLLPVGWKWPDMISLLVAETKSLRNRIKALEAA